jgi:NAD(P)-dependent dehydrogenase (short-subunit alcohol dehydrogenase family)
MSFDGRVAIVTGGGRGIGRAHAMLLATRGATVVVNDIGSDVDGGGSSERPADGVVAEIIAGGGRAAADFTSVATEEGAAGVVARALERFGRIDVLVHNAGRNLGEFRDMLDLHVGAAHWLSEYAWSDMQARGSGRIVLTSSAAGLYGDGTGPGPNPKLPYATAKAAIVGLTKALAVRGAPAGIRVNAISPTAHTRLVGLNKGIVSTRPGAPAPAALIDWVSANAPADLVAAGALWLMHDSCPVTGRVFAVGAGRVAEIFTGVNRGYIAPGILEPEDVLTHLDAVCDRDGYAVPPDMTDYACWVRSLLAARADASSASGSAGRGAGGSA